MADGRLGFGFGTSIWILAIGHWILLCVGRASSRAAISELRTWIFGFEFRCLLTWALAIGKTSQLLLLSSVPNGGEGWGEEVLSSIFSRGPHCGFSRSDIRAENS